MEPLRKSRKITDTHKAVLIEWSYPTRFIEDEFTVQSWIPKSRCLQNAHGVWCVEDWLYNKLIKENNNPALDYK